MKKVIAFVAFAGVAVLAGSAFAADTYYWHDNVGDHDIANRANWTKNNQTTVPDSFPPPLDTATTGSTHPYIKFSTGGTLALPNNSELTLQDMIFPTANTDWTIDLGAKTKTIKLFGDCDAAFWVGENYPDGQRITLKRGTITRYQATQRDSKIRFGGSNTTNKRLSYFRVDGPDAVINDLTIAVNSPNCEFCVTNGGSVTVPSASYAIRMGDSGSFPTYGSRIVVSGEGSVLRMANGAASGMFFGDALPTDGLSAPAGGLVVTDGGKLENISAVIGNRRGGFSALLDRATWTGTGGITLASAADGYSTNNVLTIRNGSTVDLSGTLTVGYYGGYNRATISGSSVKMAQYIYVSAAGKGTRYLDLGHNSLVITNGSSVTAKFIRLGNSKGPVSQNNTLFVDDSNLKLSEELTIGWLDGGNTGVVQNAGAVLATIALGVNGDGCGYNALTFSNTTFSASNANVGGQNGGGANACNNVFNVVDCTLTNAANFRLGENGGGANRLTVTRTSGRAGTISLGRKGDGCNAVLVTDCTAFVPSTFELGGNAGIAASASDGNVVRIVDSALGSADDRRTQFQIGNSYKGYPSRSNRVELVRSTWYNSATYLGIGGWNGASTGCDGNSMLVDDHSYADCTYGSDGVMIGRMGYHNRLDVLNGSTMLVNGLYLGYTSAEWRHQGTNVLHVASRSLVECQGYFQPCPGGNVIVIDDSTFATRYARPYYYYSEAGKTTRDGLAGAEAEYGKTGKEIWGTRFVFKGANPVMRTPDSACTVANYAALTFSRAHYLEFEFPPEPYEHGVLQSAKNVTIGDGTNYRFDLSKAQISIDWKSYILAEVDEGATLTVSDAEMARIKKAMDEEAEKRLCQAILEKSPDGRKLIARFRSVKNGILVIFRS